MPSSEVDFSASELAKVLCHYDIGAVEHLRPFEGGDRWAPKVVVLARRGKFILKRRKPRSSMDIKRVRFAHNIQKKLMKENYPVPRLMVTSDQSGSGVRLNGRIYELFEFIDGARYDGTAQETRIAGLHLALFHNILDGFQAENDLNRGCFHNSPAVRKYLKIVYQRGANDGEQALLGLSDDLMRIYNKCVARVNKAGFSQWPRQVVHGDWHPGNLLFKNRELVAVVDFDSVRIAPAATDLANAMLQFSIVGGRPNPADWPGYLDEKRLTEFVHGYKANMDRKIPPADALLDMMIETLIAEATLPVAATGFFGNLRGRAFLSMILKKAKWIDNHRRTLEQAISAR